MAFPSNAGTRADDLSSAWQEARQIAGEIKFITMNMKAAAQGSAASGPMILDYANNLAGKKDRLAVIATVPGLAAYAQAQVNDATLNIATEFTGMANATVTLTNWMIANFPKDASGYLLAKQFNTDNSGRQIDRMFTAASLAGFVTALNALLATID